jgi:molybdate transport system ATP-binding protein
MIEVDVAARIGRLDLAVAFRTDARVTAFFGRSGAGKTSLVNMIAGLVKPDRGRIEIDGQVLFDSGAGVNVPMHARRIGYVFQEGRLFPHYSVRRNLLYGHALVPRSARYVDFDHVVEMLGLRSLLERRPGDLSGGEKQRVAIGRALLASPRILLLDEPLASLDTTRKEEVMQYIELMRDDVRIPIVYVSHGVDEVVRLADRVVVMAAGKAAAFGYVEDIMGRPDLGTTAGIFQGGTVIDARVIAQDLEYDLATLEFEGGTLTVPDMDALVGEAVRLRIRARDVSIALEPPGAISIQNVLRGRITSVGEPREGAVVVAVAVGSVTLRSRVTRRAAEQLALKPGLEAYALVKAISLDRHNAGYAG